MPRAITPSFFEPLIHSVDVVLRRFERLIGAEPISEETARHDLGSPCANRHRDLVNLPGVTEQTVSHYEDDAERRSVHFFINVAPDALVIGDSSDLHRVIDRLISTVLENTPDGGCVTITGAVSHGVVTLGFDSYRLDTLPGEPTSSSPGLSCCLSHVGKVLRAHGGRMDLSNKRGHGLRFVLHLPVA